MKSFTAQKYPSRHYAIVGPKRSGKSTFVTANLRPKAGPAIVIDADGRTGHVASLAPVEIIGPDNPMNIVAVIEEIRQAFNNRKPTDAKAQAIIVDSVTPIFQAYSRTGGMKMEDGGNRAAQMVNKSNVMALLASLTGYGADVFYIYHTESGRRDGSGKLIDLKYTISEVERNTLARAISGTIMFAVDNGQYSATFQDGRDFNGIKPHSFTIYDNQGNNWRGGMDRIEKIAYTHFVSRSEAEAYIAKELGIDPSSAVDFYEDVKTRLKTGSSPADMWLLLLLSVDKEQQKRALLPKKQPAAVTQPPVAVSQPAYEEANRTSDDALLATDATESLERSEVGRLIDSLEGELSIILEQPLYEDEGTDGDPFDSEFPAHEPDPVMPEPGKDYRYGNGTEVAPDAAVDYLIYKKKFNRAPMSYIEMNRAKDIAATKKTGWG